MTWQPDSFLIAMPGGTQKMWGYVYRGLGLHLVTTAGRRRKKPVPSRYILTHLGSGHRLAMLTGSVSETFPIAAEIAEAGDWTFDGLRGWVNQFPDCPDRFAEIAAKYPKRLTRRTGGGAHEDIARDIAMERAA